MELNSRLYEVDIMHARLAPKRHTFTHRIFMFYIDLDELDMIPRRIRLFSRNSRNIFSFYDCDHISYKGSDTKENIRAYLKTQGVELGQGKVMLLTNVRVFGYGFSPVSFYFCFNEQQEPLAVVAEITNTFREKKPYFIGADKISKGRFTDTQTKYFYISPFLELDLPMEFRIGIPDEQLRIFIDDYKGKDKVLVTSMVGKAAKLTTMNLLLYGLRFPFVTLKVIFLIHFHAAILHVVKKIPHFRKEDNPQHQKELYHAWHKD